MPSSITDPAEKQKEILKKFNKTIEKKKQYEARVQAQQNERPQCRSPSELP